MNQKQKNQRGWQTQKAAPACGGGFYLPRGLGAVEEDV